VGFNKEVPVSLCLLAVCLLVAGWHWREDIRKHLFPAARPASTVTLVHTWTDKAGTVHFGDSGPPQSRVIAVNTDRITPLVPLTAPAAKLPVASATGSGGQLATGKDSVSDAASLRATMDGQPNDNN